MDWTPRPVIKFEFNTIRVTAKENLDMYLEVAISGYENEFGIESFLGDYSDRFANLLRIAHEKTGRQVAVLMDEYDALLVNTLEKDDLNSYYRETLKSLFKVLKTADKHIFFAFMPRVEEETCNSRMDVMLRTRRFIYIFELKTDGSVEKGMQQIEEKGYALPYADEGRTIIKIAANYSSASNNIDSYKIEIQNPSTI